MKKCPKTLLAAGLAVAMVAPMVSTSALAATTGNTTTPTTYDNTIVKYEVTEEYTWSIHSEIDFGKDNKVTGNDIVKDNNNTVSVSKNVIPDGKKLQITVKGNGGGETTDGSDTSFVIANGDTKLNYTVKAGNTDITTNVTPVLEVAAGTNTGSANMTFTLSTKNTTENAAEVAGSYVGKVIYTATIVNK